MSGDFEFADGTALAADEDVLGHLYQIEHHARAARSSDARMQLTPWDFRLPSGNDLLELRKTCGLTQEEVADELGCTDAAISHIEASRSNPSARKLANILRLYRREWPQDGDVL